MIDYKVYKKKIPASFKSDGCTMVPDFNFRQCCRLHDYALNDSDISSHAADVMLRECISDNANPIIAWVYFIGVRLVKTFGVTGVAVISGLPFLLYLLIEFG